MPVLTSTKNFLTATFTKVKNRLTAWRGPKANAA